MLLHHTPYALSSRPPAGTNMDRSFDLTVFTQTNKPGLPSWAGHSPGLMRQMLRIAEYAPAFFPLDFLARVPLPHEYDQAHP